MNLKQFGYTVALVVIALSMVSGQSLTERKLRQRQSMQEIDQLLSNEGRTAKLVMAESVTHKAEIDKRMDRAKNKQAQWIDKAGDGTSLDRVYNILKKQQLTKRKED